MANGNDDAALVYTPPAASAEEIEAKAAIFRKELSQIINRHSMENGSDTPDFILAEYWRQQEAAK